MHALFTARPGTRGLKSDGRRKTQANGQGLADKKEWERPNLTLDL